MISNGRPLPAGIASLKSRETQIPRARWRHEPATTHAVASHDGYRAIKTSSSWTAHLAMKKVWRIGGSAISSNASTPQSGISVARNEALWDKSLLHELTTTASDGCVSFSGRGLAGAARVHPGASGHAISTRHPGPEKIVNRKPCNLTIAVTRLRPRPTPGVFLILSER